MTDSTKPIYVTQPSLPPLEDVTRLMEGIWDRRILTNGGPLHHQLEEKLCEYLGVEHISLFANGTLALLVALKALRLQGEVITTPFSFVATCEALTWNGLEPVFADVDPNTFCIDPEAIEACITPRTVAILPVHCYGNPCDIHAIQTLADDYNLKVIYDAAHAFGVECDCGSLLMHGDLSVLSFHATKIFNTFEGGAVISPDAKTKKRIDRIKNFGFVDELTVAVSGINAKMSELHAAVGLAQLPYVDSCISQRRLIADMYSQLLAGLPGIILPNYTMARRHNYAYYPIRVTSSSMICRESLVAALHEINVMPRRYFYPLIPSFQCYRSNPSAAASRFPLASTLANEILCLPIYPSLGRDDILRIVNCLQQRLSS